MRYAYETHSATQLTTSLCREFYRNHSNFHSFQNRFRSANERNPIHRLK